MTPVNKPQRAKTVAAIVVALVIILLLLHRCGRSSGPLPVPTPTPVLMSTLTPVATLTPSTPIPLKPAASAPPVRTTVKPTPVLRLMPKATPAPSPAAPRPKVELHPELIPRDIKIVRVYYVNMIGAPGDVIEFDINGSGFTQEFQRMITVQSGRADVAVNDLTLITPNQIHGRLVTDAASKTDFSFPTVSIGGKVVFQAPEPFAVIRPAEVLNLVFTEMGESGRTGRFRIFTNLTQDMFTRFSVIPSTPTIQIANLTPTLPFIVDGSVLIGPAVTGEYGVQIQLAGKPLWQKEGIIRIVRPNLGQSGLVQRLQAEDGYQRPGDTARFLVQGSGFRFEDAAALKAEVKSIEGETATFLYLAPGRMGLDLKIPDNAPEGSHGIVIRAGDATLLDVPAAFMVVPKNWIRDVRPQPPLKPGTASQLVLTGRSLDKEFVEGLATEVDEPGLIVGPFTWIDDRRAVADIEARPGVKPGDYQIRMKSAGKPVVPQAGDIVNVSR